METNSDKSIDKRGLGEIIDEACTLALKISNNVKKEDSMERFRLIIEYLESYVKKHPQYWALITGITLLFTNSVCWNAQDQIMAEKQSVEDIAKYAKEAQELNKMRNILMGLLNNNEGIITEKSY